MYQSQYRYVANHPATVAAGVIVPATDSVKQNLTIPAKYEDQEPFPMYGEISESKIIVPRNAVVFGSTLADHTVDRPVEFNSSFQPRSEEQHRIVSESHQLLLNRQDHVVRAPTGTGKTYMGTQIACLLGQQTLVIVTKEDIVEQWFKAIRDITGEDAGLIQGDTVDVRAMTVAMIHSYCIENRYDPEVYQSFGFAMVDECHRVGATEFSKSMWNCPGRYRLGLSATDERKDGRGPMIPAHLGPTLVTSEAYAEIPRIIMHKTGWSPLMNTHKGTMMVPHKAARMGKVHKMMVSNLGRMTLGANYVKACYMKDRKLIVFCHLRIGLARLMEMAEKLDIPNAAMSLYVGGMTAKQREIAKKARVIFATYAMTSEATDIPDLEAALMLTPKADVVQVVGRVCRSHPDKKQPVVIDLVDHSPILSAFARKREAWYQSITDEINKL